MIDPESSERLLLALIATVYVLVSLLPPSARRTRALIAGFVGLTPLIVLASWPSLLVFASGWLGTQVGRYAVLPGALAVVARYVGARIASRGRSMQRTLIAIGGASFLVFVVLATDNWAVELASLVGTIALAADAWREPTVTAEE